jgi:hypothetical protein
LAAVAAAVLVTFNHRCWAEKPAQADTNKPMPLTTKLEPREVAIEAMMERIANADPQRAKELEKLRETDPEEFKKEIGKTMREMSRRQEKSYAATKDRRGSGQHMEMPFETRGQRGRRWSAIMRQRHEEYLEWLQDNYPDQANELIELRKQDPQLYMRKLGLSFKTYGKIAEVAKENLKLAEILKEDLELKKQRDSLLSRIKDTTDDKKKQQLVKELEEVVSARFDLIVKRTQIQYEQLSKKLERLKKELKQKEAKVEKWKDSEFKKQNVKARMEKLLSETEKFRWE